MNEVKLTYHGHSMFEIQSSDAIKIITDPYNEQIKTILPDVSGDIALLSHDHFDHANISIVRGNPEVVKSPDKAEVKGIKIEGLSTYHDTKNGQLRGNNILFKFVVDEIIFAHLGDLGHIPGESTFNNLSGVNILMIPVGGIYTVNATDATDIVKRIKPTVVIPMHYKEQDSKLEVDTVDSFLAKWNDYKRKGHSVTISKDGLPAATEIWVMESK